MTTLSLDVSSGFYKFVSVIENTVKSVFKAIETANTKRAQHFIIRNTIRELQTLTDNELRDIGISRGDIYSIAHQDMLMKSRS